MLEVVSRTFLHFILSNTISDEIIHVRITLKWKFWNQVMLISTKYSNAR